VGRTCCNSALALAEQRKEKMTHDGTSSTGCARKRDRRFADRTSHGRSSRHVAHGNVTERRDHTGHRWPPGHTQLQLHGSDVGNEQLDHLHDGNDYAVRPGDNLAGKYPVDEPCSERNA
jgi:hypothetical protein